MRFVILIYYLTDPWNLDYKDDFYNICHLFVCLLVFLFAFFMREEATSLARDSPLALSKFSPHAFHASHRHLNCRFLLKPHLAFDEADRYTTLNTCCL